MMDKELLYRFFRGDTAPEEDRAVMDWLEADPSNNKILDSEREIFNAIVLHAPDNKSDGKTARKISRNRSFFRYVASIASIILIGLLVGYFAKERVYMQLAEESVKLTVPSGQRVSITLQDGTLVWLNAETEIEYPVLFGKDRRVKINGEALFDVQHDPKRPFIVETFACDVSVLGTKFNIIADSLAGNFSTALMSGSIKVQNHHRGNEKMTLQPNEKVSLVGGYLYKQEIDDPDEYCWPDGLISLKSRSFSELMDRFEKYYGVKIVVERKSLPHVKYAGKIRVSDGIDHAFKVLQRVSDFEYRKDEQTNEIYIK